MAPETMGEGENVRGSGRVKDSGGGERPRRMEMIQCPAFQGADGRLEGVCWGL